MKPPIPLLALIWYLKLNEVSTEICSETESHVIELPRGCNPRTYDAKKCRDSSCKSHTTNRRYDDEPEYCCGPTLQDTVVVDCDNEISIDVVVTKQCGCIVCNQVKNQETGEVSTQDTSVVFYGRAFGVDDNAPLEFGEVLLGSVFETSTGPTGNFQFKVPKGQTRIVVTIRPSLWFRQNLIPTTKVFQIPTSHIGAFYRNIPMMTKPNPIEIDPTETNILTIATLNASGDPFVQISIPPGQFEDSQGANFTGKVNAFINFVHPSINMMSGYLTFEDEDGDTGPMQTSGMFRVSFEKLDGTEVKFKGSIDAAVSADFIDQIQIPFVQVYTLNETSGRWGNPTPLEKETGRQKRSKASFPSTFFVGNAVLTDKYWIKIHRRQLNYCFINMRMYTDATFSTEIPWTSSTDLTVIALGSRPGSRSFWDIITTGGMSYQRRSKVKSTKNCILTVCGATNIHAYLFAENENGAFSSSATLGGSPPTYSVVNRIPAFTGAGPTTTHNRPIETIATLGVPVKTKGPVYHSANNPSWSSVQCQKATISDPHYRFYRDPNVLYEYSVCLTIPPILAVSPICPATPALWPLAWFPQAPSQYWAWYIKVRVLADSSADESSVRAMSKDSGTGNIYGIREDTTSSRTVCLEFKGSGPALPSGTATTLVEIDVQGTGCSVSSIRPVLASFQDPSSSHLFAFQPPLGSSHGGVSSGLYFAAENAVKTAKDLAKARCECSDIFLRSPSCDVPFPSTGVGLTVKCQPTPSG